MQFGVTAQLKTTEKTGLGVATGSRQIPYFEINGDVQGTRDARGAEIIAREILDPLKVHGDALIIVAELIPYEYE